MVKPLRIESPDDLLNIDSITNSEEVLRFIDNIEPQAHKLSGIVEYLVEHNALSSSENAAKISKRDTLTSEYEAAIEKLQVPKINYVCDALRRLRNEINEVSVSKAKDILLEALKEIKDIQATITWIEDYSEHIGNVIKTYLERTMLLLEECGEENNTDDDGYGKFVS